MKTAKKLIACVLSIAMLLGVCSVGAFAFDTDEMITFEYLDSTTKECRYIGEFELGYNYHEYDGGETTVIYSFTAEESGYYATDNFNHHIGQKVSDSKVKQIDIETNYYQLGCYYVYLEEGTYYFADSFYQSSPEPQDLNVEFLFLGEYEGVSYDERVFELALEGVDVDFYNGIVNNAKPTINFSENDLEDNEGRIYVDCDGELALGSNTVTFDIDGVEFTEELYIVEVTDVVERIEVADVYDLNAVTETFDSVYYLAPDKLNVYFTDGSFAVTGMLEETDYSYEEDYLSTHWIYYVELPNGREIPIYLDQNMETVEVRIGNELYICEETEIVALSFSENLNALINHIQLLFDFAPLFTAISLAFSNISEFISYYI